MAPHDRPLMLLGLSLLGLGLQLTSGAPTAEGPDAHQTHALAPEASDQVMLMASPRPPIQFVHMHKAGGTSFWHLAQENGERLNALNSPKHWGHDGTGDMCNPSPGFTKTCKRHLAEFTRNNLTFIGLERWIDDEDEMCTASQLMYVTLLRKPLARMVSNVQYSIEQGARWKNGSDVLALLAEGEDPLVQYDASGSICSLMEQTAIAFDNFYTRSLAGADACVLPAGSITREHLETAKARLRGLDVVLILEEFDDHAPQMQWALGWKNTSLEHENSEAKIKKAGWGKNFDGFFTEAHEQILSDANKLDEELYSYAQELAASKTRRASRAMSMRSRYRRHAAD